VRIVISEFIDDAALASLARDFDVRYDAEGPTILYALGAVKLDDVPKGL
jgi:hypothetical protein